MADNMDKSIEEVAHIYKALSNPRRIAIILFLMHQPNRVSVSTITSALDLSQPIVSKQLNVLYRYQIVSRQKRGLSVLYTVDDPHIVEMIQDMMEHVKHEMVGKPHPKNLF